MPSERVHFGFKKRTCLYVTFCDIERSDTCVGEATGKSTAEHTLGVVGGIVRNGASKPAQVRVSNLSKKLQLHQKG
jgi:hypothetical protein